MKKCKGCGVILQYTDKTKEGYVPSVDFDTCQRCFRLAHYGDLTGVLRVNNNDELFKEYKKINNALFVAIVDCFDGLYLDKIELLDIFKDKDVLLIINKLDLLPRNITDDKINELYSNSLRKYKNKINCLITYKNDESFNELFFDSINDYKKLVFVGYANAGKSTIINKLVGSNKLTTSIYPNTTIKFNSLKFNGYEFIDTPGIISEDTYLSYLDTKLIKKLLPKKTIKATSFQAYSNQSYFVEGLVEFDIYPKKNATISFMINNELDIHRTKLENASNYLERNKDNLNLVLLPFENNKYHVKKFKTFYLRGLGLFKVKGECDITIKVNDKIRIYSNEVNI